MYSNSSEKFDKVLNTLTKTAIKVIHVVRNPYDVASTRLLYADAVGQSKIECLLQNTNSVVCMRLEKQVNRTITLTTHVLTTTSLDVLDVHLVDIIEDPGRALQTLCTFLGVDSTDYINTCANKLYKKVSRTRDTVKGYSDLARMVDW